MPIIIAWKWVLRGTVFSRLKFFEFVLSHAFEAFLFSLHCPASELRNDYLVTWPATTKWHQFQFAYLALSARRRRDDIINEIGIWISPFVAWFRIRNLNDLSSATLSNQNKQDFFYENMVKTSSHRHAGEFLFYWWRLCGDFFYVICIRCRAIYWICVFLLE